MTGAEVSRFLEGAEQSGISCFDICAEVAGVVEGSVGVVVYGIWEEKLEKSNMRDRCWGNL